MRRLAGLVAFAVVVGAALIGAAPATAIINFPVQEGDPCAATGASTAQAATVLTNGTNGAVWTAAPPEAAPHLVITHWKVNAPAGIGPIPEQLIVTRATGEEDEQLIGESALETVVGGGSDEFATRIPVSEYAHVGLRGPDGALVCAGESTHLAGLVSEPWATGESKRIKIEVGMGVPVIATIEPDRDGDGYGDETQDDCPYLATVHTACPFVRFRPRLKARRRGILLEVNTDDPTTVEVSGQVGWGYRPKGGGAKRRLIVGLPTSSQEVGKEATVTFWLALPPQVTQRLAELTRAEELKARLAVVVTNVVGEAVTHMLTAQLHGWKKRVAPPSP
jgi:hypothetical protein